MHRLSAVHGQPTIPTCLPQMRDSHDRCRWFQSRAEVQTLECLRCGFVKQPVPASAANANQQ